MAWTQGLPPLPQLLRPKFRAKVRVMATDGNLETSMPVPSEYAAMREALEAALQSHVRLGKAYRCECSLCTQIRDALGATAGQGFADRVREECAQIADWKAQQIKTSTPMAPEAEAPCLTAAFKTAREVADRIRTLKGTRL